MRFLEAQFPEDGVRLGRERQIWDRTRVDLLTNDLAVEVDWAKKWPEAIGQSAWYAVNFKRLQGVCLLSEDFKADARYIYRCQVVCAKCGIEFWLVNTTGNYIVLDGDKYDLPEAA